MTNIHVFAIRVTRSILIGCSVFFSIASITSSLAGGDAYDASQTTDKALYRISISPVNEPVVIGRLHDWIVHVETDDGKQFTPSQLVITGGMPGHGHGIPSRPKVTRYLKNGDFLVEGMLFNMGGTWQILVGVTGPDGFDSATFEISIFAPPINTSGSATDWTASEISILKSLWIGSVGSMEADGSNRFSNSADAASLGKKLFFDANLSASGKISCASCHQPEKKFTDGKRVSFGSSETKRNAQGLLGVGYHTWFYWDGRRDSLWAQALTPIETQGEMDNNRTDAVRYVLQHTEYGQEFIELGGHGLDVGDKARFKPGAGPFTTSGGKQLWLSMSPEDRESVNQTFADIGKIIAAYVEQLRHQPSRFDEFVEVLIESGGESANAILDTDERKGLKLFLDSGRTQCLRCHNGPLFTNFGFHNIATGGFDGVTLDLGRMVGLQAALVNEFNCNGEFSDSGDNRCAKLEFAADNHGGQGAFKVPGLRDVGDTHPYMHDGRFSDLYEVIRFYTQVPDAELEPHEVPALSLSQQEIEQMVAFLKTLTGSS